MRTFTKFFLSLFLLSGLIIAQSNHSITVDGVINTSSGEQWNNDHERFSTSTSGTYGYITWDADSIYVAWPQVDFDGNNQAVYVVIDTDPTGSNGTTDLGYEQWYRGSKVIAPFKADYIFMAKEYLSSLEKHAYYYDGSDWQMDGANGTTDHRGDMNIAYGNASGNNKDVEISISRSGIGVDADKSDIKIIVYCKDLDQNSGWGYLHRAIPDNGTTDGTGDKTFSHYYGYTLGSGYNPNDGNAYDYIMRKNYSFLSFDGTDDYVKYFDDDSLGKMDGSTDYTIEAWIYPNSSTVAEYDRVLQRYYSFAIVMYDGNNDGNVEDWYFYVYDDGSSSWKYYNTEGDSTLKLDTWNHIAVINNSTEGSLKLFVNGSDVTTSGGYSNQSLRPDHSADNLYIGQKGNGTDFFSGYIDEVRLLNKAIDPSELHVNVSDNAYMSDVYTAALFHFDEGTGSTTENTVSGTTARLGGTSEGDAAEPTWMTDVSGLPLPVELTSFTANASGTIVKLNWQTATEINNYGFEIERATENSEWQKIGFVEGAGNSNSPKEYMFTDNVGKTGNYSYRLKQIDINGEYKYSQAVEVSVGLPTKFELKQNYPNPFNPTTTIKYSIPSVIARSGATRQSAGMLVQLKVYDMLGREVATLVNKEQTPGNYSVEFDASRLSSGVYFYALKAGEFAATKKMILMKQFLTI